MSELGHSDQPLASRHDTALVDLDGVVYVGPDAVPVVRIWPGSMV